MKPARKRRLITIIAVLIGVSSALSLLLIAKEANINHYIEIADVHAGKAPIGEVITIGGLVQDGSIVRESGSLRVKFDVTDTEKEVTVEYEGVLPDLFREGQGVLAKGKLIDKHTFAAQSILAKHDENYFPKEVKEELEKKGYFKHNESYGQSYGVGSSSSGTDY